jgi:cell division septation protein DedD
MRGVFDEFDENEIQPVKRRRDTELTLGPCLLLTIFFALVLLCGLCFGLGYSMGSRGSKTSLPANPPVTSSPGAPSSGAPSSGAPVSPQSNDFRPKPAAAPPAASLPQNPASGLAPSAASGAVPAGGAPNPGSLSIPGAGSPVQGVVKPALPTAILAQAPVYGQPAGGVSAASAPAPALMVQIAAVAHEQDAEVLVGALRRRNYAVTARRDPSDNLIHVRIGPFRSLNQAEAMRRKLPSEGYNAIVEPSN